LLTRRIGGVRARKGGRKLWKRRRRRKNGGGWGDGRLKVGYKIELNRRRKEEKRCIKARHTWSVARKGE
jgi:hypothetical protein